MPRILYLLLLLALFACNTKPKPSGTDLHKEQALNHLLSRYKKISFDSLNIYPATTLSAAAYRFTGKRLDSSDISLLPKSTENVWGDTGLFGCYRFRLDSTRWGLITRVPSEYESSSIRLFIYDGKSKLITGGTELAETWGDAGDSYEQSSWICKETRNVWNVYSNITSSYDHSVANSNDTTIDTKEIYRLYRISEHKLDTIKLDDSLLLGKWNMLNRITTK